MGCCKKTCGKNEGITEEQKAVLEALAMQAGPAACKEIAAVSGLDSKVVSCRIKTLKDKGYIDSPARCKYAITDAGRTVIS